MLVAAVVAAVHTIDLVLLMALAVEVVAVVLVFMARVLAAQEP
mgnify:CR=1 FL=1